MYPTTQQAVALLGVAFMALSRCGPAARDRGTSESVTREVSRQRAAGGGEVRFCGRTLGRDHAWTTATLAVVQACVNKFAPEAELGCGKRAISAD